ncbi:MAG: DUF1624 domain-containing protein [Bauldia sp.]|nr:DUF1624 domain-containing protein [Bauldia sp.]
MAESNSRRLAVVDVARGVAIVSMVAYHFTLDLGPAFYGIIPVDAASDPILKWWARLTAGSFLFLVGVGLVLANRNGIRWPRYFRRLAIIVAAAVAVTIATRIFVPEQFVRFGILHAIAAVSVVGLLFLRVPAWLILLAAVAAFAAPYAFTSIAFVNPWWLWLGLTPEWALGAMFDYVPLLPWMGATLLGIAATRIALARGLDVRWSAWQPRGTIPRMLQWAGRWSLVIYLLHQLILLAPYFALVALGNTPPFF